MNIQKAAEASGLTADTIRFYEREGVVPPAPRRENGYREYTSEHVAVLRLARGLRDLPVTCDKGEWRVLGQYSGEGYGVMTAQVAEAIHIAAQTDAIILDPNYTGTTMAALIDQIEQGGFDNDETVIFLHTGGLPAVFTFAEQLAKFKQ